MRDRRASNSSIEGFRRESNETARASFHKRTWSYADLPVTDEFDPLLLRPVVYGSERVICCHRAGLSGTLVPNSLSAVDECVAANVPRLEIDIRFLADDAMAVFHDARLETETTGLGAIEEHSRESLAMVRHRSDSDVGIAYLQDVVERMAGSGVLLQVDLKPLRPLSPARLRALEIALAPLGDKVLVGSQAHWNLRLLRDVPVAFDPSLQWRYEPGRSAAGIPRTLGDHGLWDDSPLAASPFVTPQEYAESRIDDLVGLLPRAVEWMVDIETILHFRTLGIALGDSLRSRGISLAAWTLQVNSGEPAVILDQLFAGGTTTVITDIPLVAAAAAGSLGVAAA